jgi:hypothetical protein
MYLKTGRKICPAQHRPRIPTEGNVHEVAQQADHAARVAYVDVDPVAIGHCKALPAGNESRPALHRRRGSPWQIVATLRDALPPGSYLAP